MEVKRRFRLRFGLRTKLLIVSSFLLLIPYLSYQYIWQLEEYLKIGQEQALVGTARSVATVLHERPSLFDKQSVYLANISPASDLYAHRIEYPINLDAELNDWREYKDKMITYGASNLVEQSAVYEESSLSFKHIVGQYGKYFYAMFEVHDDKVVFRQRNSYRVDQSDFLQIGLIDSRGIFKRYAISPMSDGWVNTYKITSKSDSITPSDLETRIQGRWQTTSKGYNVELRFPLSMLSSKIAFAISDVDDINTRNVKYVMGTANPSQSDSLGTVLLPSPEIERIIKGLEYARARVWVVDKHMRVLARSGNIQDAIGVEPPEQKEQKRDSASPQQQNPMTPQSLWTTIENSILLPVYYKILTKPPADFIDDLAGAFSLKGNDIGRALEGETSTMWRFSPDNKAVILSASHPIFIDGKVMGAVVVEQTTHGIRSLRNQALEKQFHYILAFTIITTLTLMLFASRISTRIRKLRDKTESAIDGNGKIIKVMKPSRSGDEIGDLSRSFNKVLTKLSQYNQYLEKMASRLSHELRTPVAVVNSSLENLSLGKLDEEQSAYVDRAKTGITRLSKILNSMSEATRLEQAISNTESETFDLVNLLKGCVQGYQMSHENESIELDLAVDEVSMHGSPEMFAQMLDKIISNAIDFRYEGSKITIRLFKKKGKLALSITNTGALLPEHMQSQLLQSMISVRANTSSEQAHLGLGLFIANMIAIYHKGQLSIDNLPDHSGVIVLIEFDI